MLSRLKIAAISLLLSSCSDPDLVFEQTAITCVRFDKDYQICEGDIASDLITGYIKVFVKRAPSFSDPTLFLCGGDLDVKLGNLLHNSIIANETENNLMCLDADENDISWYWDDDSGVFFSWETIELLIISPECRYDDFPCSYNAGIEFL